MKAFRDYILAEIQTRLPALKTVRMFNNQFERSNNDDFEKNIEAPFGYPACFVELEETEVRNVALGIKYVDLIVRLHIGLENYTKQRPDDYITIDDISDAMQGMRGDESDTVQFSSMEEQTVTIDVDYNNVNRPVLEFNTTYTKLSNYKRRNFVTKAAPTALQTDATITVEDEGSPVLPPCDPPQDWEELVALIGRGYNYPQPTGQTTVYRTGDDADIEATVFAPIRAANDLKAKNSIKPDFITLNNPNVFGNTNRFTDSEGLQDYGATGSALVDYVIDNYTGIAWYRALQGSSLWEAAIDAALASTQGGFDDWFLPSLYILNSISKALGSPRNYAPFSIANSQAHTSTTHGSSPTLFLYGTTGLTVAGSTKETVSRSYIFCRKHF